MKKLKIYLFLLVPLVAFSDLNIEKVNGVLSSIESNQNKPLTYYSDKTAFINKLKIKKTNSPQKANIILFPKNKDNKKDIIVDSFEKLKNNKKSIGAIYVKKGRTQIIFVKERLEKRGLKLPKKYNKYLIKKSYLCPICLLDTMR